MTLNCFINLRKEVGTMIHILLSIIVYKFIGKSLKTLLKTITRRR